MLKRPGLHPMGDDPRNLSKPIYSPPNGCMSFYGNSLNSTNFPKRIGSTPTAHAASSTTGTLLCTFLWLRRPILWSSLLADSHHLASLVRGPVPKAPPVSQLLACFCTIGHICRARFLLRAVSNPRLLGGDFLRPTCLALVNAALPVCREQAAAGALCFPGSLGEPRPGRAGVVALPSRDTREQAIPILAGKYPFSTLNRKSSRRACTQ